MAVAGLKKAILRTGFEALYFSGSHVWLRPFVSGIGAILTLHHVRQPRRDAFQPNRLLEVTPAFLEAVILRLRRAAIDLVSLDDMHRRLTAGERSRRFACLTFDDGYRDNLEHAYPILKKHGAPFALYIPTSFPDRLGELWWLALEAVIARNHRIGLVVDGEDRNFDCRTTGEKREVYEAIYWWLRRLPSEEDLRNVVRDLATRYQVDIAAFCRDLCMDWNELEEISRDPLVTIGAHTVNHVRLTKVPEKTARAEMRQSAAVIESALGRRPEHLSYPVGDPTSAGPREFAIAGELGFKTAVTTRPGVLFPEHREHLTALPRISLNGEYQQMRYVEVLLSGAATAILNKFRRVDAA
jgi:peptidoglycan/xylan/chitin deacetylase (PgdA/CDA1 family)